MRYYQVDQGHTDLGYPEPKSRLEKLLKPLLPAANPDFEEKFDSVRHWWLEADDAWVVHREIGFDIGGQPIVAAPLGKNHGIYTDHVGGVPLEVHGSIEQAEFERVWQVFTNSWSGRPR